MVKQLPTAVVASLTPAEAKKLKLLREKHAALGAIMIDAQAKYTTTVRQQEKESRRLADKGFAAEARTLKALDALLGFQEALKKKYSRR